jgi:hypothetical protein
MSTKGTIIGLLSELSEDDAISVYHAMAQQYGWAGTFFTRDDAEYAWNAERTDNGEDQAEMPDEVWEQFLETYAWRKGLIQLMTEYGWELLGAEARAIVEGVSEGKKP